MKIGILTGLIVLGVVGFALRAQQVPGSGDTSTSPTLPSVATRWEYRVIRAPADTLPSVETRAKPASGEPETRALFWRSFGAEPLVDIEKRFNELGAEGWELQLYSENDKLYVFRRAAR